MGIDSIFDDVDIESPQSSIIRVNRYEIPQQALNLISHICTAHSDIDITSQWEIFNRQIGKKIIQNAEEYDLKNVGINISAEIDETVSMICNSLENGGNSLRIAVGGGYSAGKSSFLNAITGVGSLLPTGIDPVSIVNTYLNCTSDTQKIIIRGENLKGHSVLLNEDTLACIQHSSSSKVYVASVLEKLTIDVPAADFFDNITFIDTPGYNNSSACNEENDTKDRDTAKRAINEADALFWCIDIDAGTVSMNDFEILRFAKGKPVVIFFTKMDKKPEDEVDSILKSAYEVCQEQLGKDNMPLDIVGVVSNTVMPQFKSFSDYAFNQIIDKIRDIAGKKDIKAYYKKLLQDVFDTNIAEAREFMEENETHRKELIKEKSDLQEELLKIREQKSDFMAELEDVLVGSYDAVLNGYDQMQNLFADTMDELSKSLDREVKWSNKSGFFSDTSSLSKQYNRAIDNFSKYCDREEALNFEYYKTEYRKNLCDRIIKEGHDDKIKQRQLLQKYIQEDYKNLVSLLDKCRKFTDFLIEIKNIALSQFDELFDSSLDTVKKHNVALQCIKEEEPVDIFTAIKTNSYDDFLACFSLGVDMQSFDNDGFSPFTLAAKFGNNEMIKFLIDHNADPSLSDARGYNAFETAVMYHYQDICEMLLKKDKSLVHTPHRIEDLIAKNKFSNWICNIVNS